MRSTGWRFTVYPYPDNVLDGLMGAAIYFLLQKKREITKAQSSLIEVGYLV